jgi:pyruvate/2-oxoglutarate/acetoin dehydrogenase E1 component
MTGTGPVGHPHTNGRAARLRAYSQPVPREVIPGGTRAASSGTGSLGDPGELLLEAIRDPGPVLFVENKLLYASQLKTGTSLGEFEFRPREGTLAGPSEDFQSPCYTLAIRGAPQPDLTLGTYGYMLELAMEAATTLAFEHEVFCELVVPTQLSPFKLEQVWVSAQRTGRLLTIEEGNLSLGWGAEVLAQAAEVLGSQLRVARRVAAADLPVPASQTLEGSLLPGVESIIHTTLEIMHGR